MEAELQHSIDLKDRDQIKAFYHLPQRERAICHHLSQTRPAVALRRSSILFKVEGNKADKPNKEEEPVEDKVGEITKMVNVEEECSIIHQEDQSLEDPSKQ